MARFRRFMLATLGVAAGLMIASAAEAQCIEGNLEMVCPVEVCEALDAAVFAACKGPNSPKSCDFINGCAALQAETAKWEACLAAREEIKRVCFPTGTSHDQAREQVVKNIRNCKKKMMRREPIGCAKRCP